MAAELGPRALMRRAMELAEEGRGRTSPNPVVGALILKEGKIIGEGYHPILGGPHAEAVALQAAGIDAYGSTLVTTLEPCKSFGRTPPCLDAILSAGVAKVIIGSVDPNPKVNGESIKKLRAEGVEVEVGICADEVARQSETYFKFITSGKPFVLVKAAMTVDGKLSVKKGVPTALTDKDIREEMHKLRAVYDAILVGIETILSDNPRLTARLKSEVPRQPARVILDTRGRIPIDSAVVRTAGDILTFVATTQQASDAKVKALEEAGVVVLVIPEGDGGVSLEALLKELGSRSVTSMIVEGGSTVHTSFVRQRLVDKYVFLYAPYLAGGRTSPNMIEGENLTSLQEAEGLRFAPPRLVGRDICVEAYPTRFDPQQAVWAVATRAAAEDGAATPKRTLDSMDTEEIPAMDGRKA